MRRQTDLLAQLLVQFLPSPIHPKEPIIIMHRSPRRQIVRQLPPGATGPQQILDAVDHLAHDHLAVAATRLLRRDVRFDQLPLLIREV